MHPLGSRRGIREEEDKNLSRILGRQLLGTEEMTSTIRLKGVAKESFEGCHEKTS